MGSKSAANASTRASGTFTVTARDANGNIVTGYTGIVQFTKSCIPRRESHGVRVNCVCPGLVETDMVHESGDGAVADWRRPMYDSVELLRPEDFAAAVLALVRDDTQVGAALAVDNPD